MLTKEEYLRYMDKGTRRQMERIYGKYWTVRNIPTYLREEIERGLVEEAMEEEWEDRRREEPQTEEEWLEEQFGDAPSY